MSYDKGFVITGLDRVPSDITVFHAGTARPGEAYVTNGGRVLGVTASGATLEEASARAYEGVACIGFNNAHYRTDIGRSGSSEKIVDF